jgi:hypothetical protein
VGHGHCPPKQKLSRTDPFIKKKNKETEDLDDVFIFLFFVLGVLLGKAEIIIVQTI